MTFACSRERHVISVLTGVFYFLFCRGPVFQSEQVNIVGGFRVTKKMLDLFKRPGDPEEYNEARMTGIGEGGGWVVLGMVRFVSVDCSCLVVVECKYARVCGFHLPEGLIRTREGSNVLWAGLSESCARRCKCHAYACTRAKANSYSR